MKTKRFLMLALAVGTLLTPAATAFAGKAIHVPDGYTSYCDMVDCDDPIVMKYPGVTRLGVKLDFKIKVLTALKAQLPPDSPRVVQVQSEVDKLVVELDALIQKIMQLPEYQQAAAQQQ